MDSIFHEYSLVFDNENNQQVENKDESKFKNSTDSFYGANRFVSPFQLSSRICRSPPITSCAHPVA